MPIKTLQMMAEVDDHHRTTIQLPADVPAGSYELVIVMEEPKPRPTILDLPKHDVPWPWPADYTFRREDMYGDDGRGL